MKKIIFAILFGLIYSQGSTQTLDSIAIPQEILRLIDFNDIIEQENTVPVTYQKKMDYKITDPIPNALINVFDRLYIDKQGIEAYRQNLSELLGRIVTKGEEGNVIGPIPVKYDTAVIKTFTPENNRLISHRLTKNSSAALSLFINASATDDKIYEYMVTDISRAILNYLQIDKDRLKNATVFKNIEQIENKYIITGVTVTEIVKREFTKQSKKIKASEFPLSGVAVSFDGNFFTSNENYEREYKLGFTVTSLNKIKEELNILKK